MEVNNVGFYLFISNDKIINFIITCNAGGFIGGSSRSDFCGPDYLIEHDVIVVTFNYRLGPLGFLSLADRTLNVAGNAGLKDQVFALKWIQTNIEAFGGDKNNVTLCGESAGAVSVHLHMMSNQSRGLFHKAILVSGTAFIKSWGVNEQSNDFAARLAKKCGWNGVGGEAKILETLENANAHALMKHSAAINFLTAEEFSQFFIFSFGPVVEPYVTDNCFIPNNPAQMARDAAHWSNSIPCMIGGASLEGVMLDFMGKNEFYLDLLTDARYFTPSRELGLNVNSNEALKYGLELKELYNKGDAAPKNLKKLFEYAGDRLIWHGIYNAVLSRIEGCGKTFLFRFDADTELNFMKRMAKVEYSGASHGDMSLYFLSR